MTGTFEYEKGDKRAVPDFNVFFRYFATYPYYCDAIWFLTQMRRWGQIPEASPTTWYAETAKIGLPPDIYLQGREDAGRRRQGQRRPTFPWTATATSAPTADFIDGITYDGQQAQRLHRQPHDRPEGQPDRSTVSGD